MSAWLLICGDAAGDADNSSPLRHTQPWYNDVDAEAASEDTPLPSVSW